jgi:hypothetical protein
MSGVVLIDPGSLNLPKVVIEAAILTSTTRLNAIKAPMKSDFASRLIFTISRHHLISFESAIDDCITRLAPLQEGKCCLQAQANAMRLGPIEKC